MKFQVGSMAYYIDYTTNSIKFGLVTETRKNDFGIEKVSVVGINYERFSDTLYTSAKEARNSLVTELQNKKEKLLENLNDIEKTISKIGKEETDELY